jgi:hypothetical protein
MMSGMVVAVALGDAANMKLVSAMPAIGVKSRSTSYFAAFSSMGVMAETPVNMNSRVCPSRANSMLWTPTIPPAPGRFSSTTGFPR